MSACIHYALHTHTQTSQSTDALQPLTEVDRVCFVCNVQSLITLSHVSAHVHTAREVVQVFNYAIFSCS